MDTLPWWKNEESVDEAHQRRMQTCNSQDGNNLSAHWWMNEKEDVVYIQRNTTEL